MRAAGPATGTAHTFAHFIDTDSDTAFARLFLFC